VVLDRMEGKKPEGSGGNNYPDIEMSGMINPALLSHRQSVPREEKDADAEVDTGKYDNPEGTGGHDRPDITMSGTIDPALLQRGPAVLHAEEDGEADVDEGDKTEEEEPKESEFAGPRPAGKRPAGKQQPPQQPRKKKKAGCIVSAVRGDAQADLAAALAMDIDPPPSRDAETFNIYHIQQDVKGLVCFSIFVFSCSLTKRVNKFCSSCGDTGSMVQCTAVNCPVILCVSTLFGSSCLFQQEVEACGLPWVCPIHNNGDLILKVLLYVVSYWHF